MIANLVPDALGLVSATILIAASFFTSGLTAAAGIGGGLLMLALMTYLLPIAVLIPVHGLVQLASNAGRSWVQRPNINWRVALLFLAGTIIGALIGALMAVQLPKQILLTIMGLFILFVVWIKIPALKTTNPPIIIAGGAITTFMSMFVGATGPLVAVFLNKLFAEHRQFVATHGMAMTVQHGFKIIAFGLFGVAFWQWLPLVLAMAVSGYLGTLAGTAIMNRMPDKALKLLFKIILTVVSLDLVRRGVY